MYYSLYAFLTIIVIIIIIIIIIIGCCCCCCCCYISTQASSNNKACADWPILRGTRWSVYLITGRARGTREGGEAGLLSFSLFVRPRHFFFRSHKKAMMRGTTLEPLCARQSTERTWRGRTRGAGERGINVRSCYTGSSNKLEDSQKQTPTQVPNHDKFFDAQTTLWPSDIAAKQRAPGSGCSLTIAYTLLPGDHCSLLSLSGCQSDGMLQN